MPLIAVFCYLLLFSTIGINAQTFTDASTPTGDQVLVDDFNIYRSLLLDAMVTNIDVPESSICGNNNQFFNIQTGNNGTSDISNFPVQVSVTSSTGTIVLTETVFDTLSSGDLTLIMVGPFDMSMSDDYVIEAQSLLAGDGDLSNDTTSATLSTLSEILAFPFIEDFTSAETNYFSFDFSSLANVYFFNDNGDYILRMEGGPTNSAWSGSGINTSSSQAWSNTEHHGFANSCTIDASGTQSLDMDIDFRQTGIMTYLEYSWFRVLINDTIQIADNNGEMNFNPDQPQGDPYEIHTFDLDNFAGTEFTLTLQSSCKYDSTMTYNGTTYDEGDAVYIRHISIYGPPVIDISVIEVDGIPQSDCDLDTAQITVVFLNNGSDTLFAGDVIPLNLGVNGMVFLEGYTLPVDLAFSDTTSYVFNTILSLVNDGLYEISVWSSYTGDTITENNLIIGYTTNTTTINTFPYTQDFESNSEGWMTESFSANFDWELGTPQQAAINSAHSGINAWMTGLDTNYPNNAELYLYSPCFDFTNVMSPVISLWLYVAIEIDYDGLILEGTVDGGTTWNKVGENDFAFYTSYNNAASNPVIEFPWWTAIFTDWQEFSTMALEYAGEANVKFRFRFESDHSITLEGAAMDDFSIDDIIMLCEATASDLSICMGETVSLDVAIVGGIPPYSYDWSPATSLNDPSLQNPEATPTSTTQYSVTVTDSNSNQSIALITIEVIDNPIVELGQNITSPTPITLDAGSGHTTYLWSTGYDQQFLVVYATGEYSVTVSNSYGCETSDSITVTIANSINGIDANSFVSIYPNPAHDKVFIELSEGYIDLKITLSDITGKTLSINTIQSNSNKYELNIADLASGTYLIQLKNSEILLVKKLIVE